MYSKLAIVTAIIAISQSAFAGTYTCDNHQTFDEVHVNTNAAKCFDLALGSVGGYPKKYENYQLSLAYDSFRSFPLVPGGADWNGGSVQYFVASDNARQTKKVFKVSGRFESECPYTR